MKVSVRIPEDVLSRVVGRLERDPLVQSLLQQHGNTGIVPDEFKDAFVRGVRADMSNAKTDAAMREQRNRLGISQFIPHYLRTKYPYRLVGYIGY